MGLFVQKVFQPNTGASNVLVPGDPAMLVSTAQRSVRQASSCSRLHVDGTTAGCDGRHAEEHRRERCRAGPIYPFAEAVEAIIASNLPARGGKPLIRG